MVAGCGNKCLKYIFFAFNFLIFVLGAVIAGVSLWIRFDEEFQGRMSESIENGANVTLQLDSMFLVLYATAAIGALLCLCGFLGCCGACCESVCLLGLFFTIIMFLFVAEIVGALYIYIKKDEIRSQVAAVYKKEIVDRYDTHEDMRKHLDQVQTKFGCCGASGCGDFTNRTGGPPASCNCGEGSPPGCSDQAFDILAKHVVIVASVAVAVLALELLAMIFSCVLCNGIRNSGYEYY